MATYRFYFLDRANHIYEAEERDFAHDNEALDNGHRCMRTTVASVQWRFGRPTG